MPAVRRAGWHAVCIARDLFAVSCLWNPGIVMRWLLLSIVLCSPTGGNTACANDEPGVSRDMPTSVVTRSSIRSGWLIQETESFEVYSLPDLDGARKIPEICERLKRQLQETWFGAATGPWSPRCVIVVHPTVAGYVRELGGESRSSSGCASLDFERGVVSKRRIDLRADAADWLSTALPHELVHVVLAPQFAGGKLPRWADEGMAILSEPLERQAVRRQALQRGLARERGYRAGELMSLANYPAEARRDLFYGQSAALVAFLVEQETPTTFLEFLKTSETSGFERALQQHYKIASLAALDARWGGQVLEPKESAELLARRVARITAGSRLAD
jgi:hypothetical protein